MLRSSILGREFIRYRRHKVESDRKKFSRGCIREKKIPVVVDTVDEELGSILYRKEWEGSTRVAHYGLEYLVDENMTVKDILRKVKILLLDNKRDDLIEDTRLVLGLEDGDIADLDVSIKDMYRKYRNMNDDILYLVLTRETSTYGYIMSILTYLSKIMADTIGFWR